jgi:hypothetical protein
MPEYVILVSVPGLRESDLEQMPRLAELVMPGDSAPLVPSFPAVTCPVQANMTTGKPPSAHGVIANGFYYRDKHEIEMWTAWNDCIGQPQLWEILAQHNPKLTSAVWFPLHSKGCTADYVCTPAPIHNPDGSESLWCYTKPSEMYGELRDALGHFPLQHFWGPMANIKSSAWIIDSAVQAAGRYQPNLFYIYLPHLDYAAQKHGPNSPQASAALGELDQAFGRLIDGFEKAYAPIEPLWLIASEYAIVPVEHVAYPNRVLREAGLLRVMPEGEGQGELLDLAGSAAWALTDHQFSHVFVNDAKPEVIARVAERFRGMEGIAEVLVGDQRAKYNLDHERAGEVVLISAPNSWQAYYYWLDDALAPSFARKVDIHRKTGYDPVELHVDMATRSIPLDATLVKGSHGAPANSAAQRGVLLGSQRGVFLPQPLSDTDVADVVLRQFGV